MKLRIRSAAAQDIDEAAGWYREHSVDPRVAVRFLLEIHSVLERIAESPLAFPEVHRDIRRCRVLAFPVYSVFYRVVADDVVITAVFHGHRRPAVWRGRH